LAKNLKKPNIIIKLVTEQIFYPNKMHSFIKIGELVSSKFLGTDLSIDVLPNGILLYFTNLKDIEKIAKFTEKLFEKIKKEKKEEIGNQKWYFTIELNHTELSDKKILSKFDFSTDKNYLAKIKKGKKSGKFYLVTNSFPYKDWFKTLITQYKSFKSMK
jgi:hypothetical protein